MTHAGSTNEPDLEAGAGRPPSLLEFAAVLLRHRRLIAWCMAVPFAIAVIARSFSDVTWTSSASFVPQATDRAGGLSGLAAQFGVAVPNARAGDNQSPAFYADLLRSREILLAVLDSSYTFRTDSGPRTARLIDVLEIEGASPELVRQMAIKRLAGLMSVNMQTRTGVVTFSVKAPAQDLARQVAERLLAEVNRFNLEKRQTQAGAERQFNEQRLGELQGELRGAEERLEAFLRRNRDFRNSPELTFQRDRLAREVELRQSVYLAVAQAYERARMDQVRDTPLITVIEAPDLPPRRDGRGRVRYGLLALILGGMLGVGAAMAREYTGRRRAAQDAEYQEVAELAREAREDVRRLMFWRRQPRA